MKVDRVRNEAAVRFGSFTATVTPAEMGWGKRQPKDEFKNGYLAEFEIKDVDEKNRRLKVELSQVPAVQGAMMTLNAKTGEIVTMVGGYDFYTNKFNNAIQAYRQIDRKAPSTAGQTGPRPTGIRLKRHRSGLPARGPHHVSR